MKVAYRLSVLLLISFFLLSCAEKKSGVEGKLLDGRGKPISATIIFKQILPSKGYEQFEVKTIADGSFHVEGVMPASEYIITPVSETWKTKIALKITTLEAGQILVLSKPVVIRFNVMKDGTVVDTKTGLQWLILGIPDLNSSNVQNAVKNLKDGGFTDWRLPTKAELAELSETLAVPSTPAAPAAPSATTAPNAAAVQPEDTSVQKTCCAWVIEPTTENVEWKFYVDDGNEVWTSGKVPPDDRIIIVRNATPATPAASAQTPAVGAPVAGSATPVVIPAAPYPGSASPVANLSPEKKQVPETSKIVPAATAKVDVTVVKNKDGVLSASRKACADKNAQAAKSPASAALPVASASVAAQAVPAAKQYHVATKQSAVKEKPALPDNTGDSVAIQFAMNKSGISPEELSKLKVFYAKIKDKKGKIVIEGNSGGDTADSFKISGDRALSVKAMLYKLGLSKKVDVRITGLSDSKPISDKNTEAGRKLNRRADVTFIPE